jgi:uncharacterized short protein YbdD (DUF466 family)
MILMKEWKKFFKERLKKTYGGEKIKGLNKKAFYFSLFQFN